MTIENDRTGTMTNTPGGGGARSGTTQGGTVETAKAEATQVAGSAKEAGKEVIDEVTTQSAEVATTAKEEFDRLVDRASTEIKSVSRDRSQQLASRLDSVAQQMRALAEGRPEEAAELRRWMSQATDRMQSYASALRERGPDGMLQDVRGFARRRPGMFLLAAGISGFAIGRLVRSGAMKGTQQSTQGAMPGYGSNGRYSRSGDGNDQSMPVDYTAVTAVVVEPDETLPPPVTGTRAGWQTP